MNKTFQITNENLPMFFMTPDEIRKAKEIETEKYYMRQDHVMLDVMHDQEGNQDEE